MRGAEWRVASPDLGQMTAWRQMRQALWPEMTEAENLDETEAMMTATSRFFVRIAMNREDKLVGFVEATVRND
jgi:aminoglycoside 6'-N-acetyltransferase I